MFSGLAHINTASSRSFSHAVTFGIDVAAFTNIVQFAVHKTMRARKSKPFWRKWGPVICLAWATILVDLDLVRNMINDAWGTVCISTDSQPLKICDKDGTCSFLGDKYNKYCYSQPMLNGGVWPHLTIYGWVCTIFATWAGYLLLFVGIFWILSFPQKMRAQWRIIQRGRQGQSRGAAVSTQPLATA